MKRTMYLHVGWPKTGTTSLQNFLWHNAEVLRRADFLYPNIGIEAHHQLAAFCTTDRSLTSQSPLEIERLDRRQKLYYKYDPNAVEIYLSQIRNSSQDVIISSENFVWSYYKMSEEYFRDLFSQFRVIIIATLRPYSEFMNSTYCELLKDPLWQSTWNVDQFLDNYTFNYLNYNGIISTLISLSRASEVRINIISMPELSNGYHVIKFLESLGIDHTKLTELDFTTAYSNVTPTLEELTMIRQLSRTAGVRLGPPTWEAAKQAIQEILNLIHAPRSRPWFLNSNSIRRIEAATIAWHSDLCSNYNHDFSPLLDFSKYYDDELQTETQEKCYNSVQGYCKMIEIILENRMHLEYFSGKWNTTTDCME